MDSSISSDSIGKVVTHSHTHTQTLLLQTGPVLACLENILEQSELDMQLCAPSMAQSL